MSSVSAVPESSQAPTKGRRRFTVDALFTDHRPQAVGVEDLPTAKEIRLERIEADPDQPRRTFDLDRLEELAASIRREGVLQPIAVRYDVERDVYVVIHGERRLRAAREAGLSAIPAIVRDVPHDRRLVQQLMENIVRDDLNAVDRAAALRALKTQLGDAPWESVAEVVGIRRSRLFQLLGTEKLPDRVRDDIRGGRLSEKQSRALQGLLTGHQEALRDAIVEHELSAEEALRIARALKRADVPDDASAATAFIDHLRSANEGEPREGDALSQAAGLFAAIEAAAVGERGSVEALAAVAKTTKAHAFDGDRLRAEVLALARTLARTPADELVPGGAAYMPLSMLRGTLNALLPED
jgi:ParB family transcriptional regulator, chromosome partitioning protein